MISLSVGLGLDEVMAFLATTLIIFLFQGLPQFLDFRRIRREIQSQGLATRLKMKAIQIGFGSALLLIMILGPFLLIFFVTPLMWFGLFWE